MNLDSVRLVEDNILDVCEDIPVSRWVNEPLPAWDQLLTAHDVARLTRRPRWLLAGMVLLQRFPKKRRFRGRKIGWLRSDVLDWLTKDLG
jgi:predicted DNA-binding transcriptional regulator AlpA